MFLLCSTGTCHSYIKIHLTYRAFTCHIDIRFCMKQNKRYHVAVIIRLIYQISLRRLKISYHCIYPRFDLLMALILWMRAGVSHLINGTIKLKCSEHFSIYKTLDIFMWQNNISSDNRHRCCIYYRFPMVSAPLFILFRKSSPRLNLAIGDVQLLITLTASRDEQLAI